MQRVTEVYNQARGRLEDPGVSVDEVPLLIVFLAELAAEKLPGTWEEDPMRLYLECVQDQIMEDFQVKCGCGWYGRSSVKGDGRPKLPTCYVTGKCMP
jgi:hypothetical protein